jgi:DNA-binding MarR family transcriptional regulator
MQPFYSPETFTTRTSLGYLLRRVYKLSTARIDEALESEDITLTQWIVLVLLANDMATTCRDLCRNMNHDRGAMTRLIDQLEERGLVKRLRDEADRRVCPLALTDAGRVVLDEKTGPIRDVWNDILRDFDPAEVTQAIGTLTKLLDRLEADPDHPER